MRLTMLLVASLSLFLVGSSAGRTSRPPDARRPLSAAEVEHGLKSAMTNTRMATLVRKYGVDFELTAAVEAELRRAGASNDLILQIKQSRSRVARRPAKPVVHAVVDRAQRPAKASRAHAGTTAKTLLSQADKYRTGSGVARNEAKAVELYHKAADMGNAEAQTRLAEALFDGRGVDKSPAESRMWLEKAAKQGYARAECDLGVMLTSGLDVAEDRASGLRYLQAAARAGDGYAEDYLGQLAEIGLNGDPSPSEAYMHYLKASEMGSAWGTYNVARMHERGIGVYKNPGEALRGYMKVASMQGRDQWSDLRPEAGAVASANFRIGDMYADGNGVPKAAAESERWYQRGMEMASAGAQEGWLRAEVYLANAYRQSKGVPLDYAEAMHWMSDAAEHGNRQAQVDLGSMYRDGQGMPQNYSEAMYWYREAADRGSPEAEWMIGRLYLEGKGVSRDWAEAATWFRRSADEGFAAAEWDLGMMYYRGESGSQDIKTARSWLQKAADRGYAPAKEMLSRLNPAVDADISARPARLQ